MHRAPPAAYSPASSAGSGMSASAPLDGDDRFTSAITATPGLRRAAYASIAGGAAAASSRTCSSGTCSCRAATSSRTPARISSSTFCGPATPPAAAC